MGMVPSLLSGLAERFQEEISNAISGEDALDSPIERLFLAAFTSLYLARQCLDAADDFGFPKWELWKSCAGTTLDGIDVDLGVNCQLWDRFVVVVVPQFRVDSYTADFLIQHRDFLRDRKTGMVRVGQSSNIIVECDGHDFHDRTKEQAQHDKARDRHLTSRGYTVLRFTGSELWHDPLKCAQQVSSICSNSLVYQTLPKSDVVALFSKWSGGTRRGE